MNAKHGLRVRDFLDHLIEAMESDLDLHGRNIRRDILLR
jgi:hypothetical protein